MLSCCTVLPWLRRCCACPPTDIDSLAHTGCLLLLTLLQLVAAFRSHCCSFSSILLQLVAAFRATLEEIQDASLLLHVVDVSHPNAPAQVCSRAGCAPFRLWRRFNSTCCRCGVTLALTRMDAIQLGPLLGFHAARSPCLLSIPAACSPAHLLSSAFRLTL